MRSGPPIWLRVVFVLNIIQDLALAVGLLWPDKIPFPLTVTPLNARFIGALYLASALGMILSASSPRKIDTRIFVVAFGIVSILVLIVTGLDWSDFTTRRVPVLWLVTYFVTIGVGALMAAHERRMRAILPLVVSSLGLMVFVLLASSFHLDRFTPGLPAVYWFGSFTVGAVALAWALLVVLLDISRRVPATPAARPSAFRSS